MGEVANGPIERELGPTERLLWSGRPRRGVVFFRAADAFLIPFSLMWGGFAIFWEIGAIVDGAPFSFAVLGIPLVVLGLHMIFGRFWVDAKQRSKTYYGVTDERVIIISGLFSRTTKSLNLETLTDVALAERSDGYGTVTLGPPPPWYVWFASNDWLIGGSHSTPALEAIEDARNVYETIRDAQREAKEA